MTTSTNEQTGINVDEHSIATNTAAVNETINSQSTPSDTAAISEPINSQPPPVNTNTTAVHEPESSQSALTNTVAADKPANFQPPPPTTNTATVDKPINLQQTPTSTAAVHEPTSFYLPLANTASIDESINRQSIPLEPINFSDTATPKPAENTAVVDDLTELKTDTIDKLRTSDLNKRTTIFGVICGSSITLIILGIISIIPLLQLIIGWRYAEECPVYWRIPHYLVVAGVVGLVIIILGIIDNLLKLFSKSKPTNRSSIITTGSRIIAVVLCFLNIFAIVWFIAGCIWVFRVWNKVQYKHDSHSDYCHPTLYRFAFWLLLLSICYQLFTCCTSCTGMRRQMTSTKKYSFTPVPTTEP